MVSLEVRRSLPLPGRPHRGALEGCLASLSDLLEGPASQPHGCRREQEAWSCAVADQGGSEGQARAEVQTNSEKLGYKKHPRKVYGPDYEEPSAPPAKTVEMTA